MQKIKALLKWSWRSWPIIVPLILGGFHGLLYSAFGSQPIVNKIFSAVFQSMGGFIVIYSLNENMGVFRNHGLLTLIKNYFKEWPLVKPRTVSIQASAGGMASVGGTASVTFGRGATTVEEKLAELERQIKECRDLVFEREKIINGRIDKVDSKLESSIQTQQREIKTLSDKLQDSMFASVKLQIFGFILVIYGGVISIFS